MTIRRALQSMLLAAFVIVRAPLTVAAEPAPMPAWVVDPAAPGPHLPPVGVSLFDQLFADGRGGHMVPFPFDTLLARLDPLLARDGASTLPPVKPVLIPLGRSLQRTAAAPDYFRFPRVVLAVDAPPAPGAPLLKDRLYIGYAERSAVLEVISYNEAAGRFEFQLVKDYRAGGQPRVFYANRNICFACHQNGAPIFSRALWDETNANPAIAARLDTVGRRFYGIPTGRGVDLPYAIDKGVRRANLFALTQRLWREGCGPGDPGAACRAGLFAAAIRLRLAGGRAVRPDAAFDEAVARPLRSRANQLWPDGLAIGRSDLPNRNPLQGVTRWPDAQSAQLALSHVPARFEPLAPRPPDAWWRADAPEALAEAVAGVAEFVADGQWPRVEAALARRAGSLPRGVLALDCVPQPASRASRCRGPGGASLDLADGRISRLSLAGEPPQPAFALGEAVRLAGGDWLERVDASALKAGAGPLQLRLRTDSRALASAMDALVASPEGAALLADRPIPGAALVAALLKMLGEAPARPPQGVPPTPRLETPDTPPRDAPMGTPQPRPLAAFHAWCAACHLSAEQFPPNFLQGPRDELEARLRQCAPRILVRLTMARRLPAAREKTPMPPESMLPAFGIHPAAWATSPERAEMETVVATMLRLETGREPDPDALLAGGYESLRPCLATGAH